MTVMCERYFGIPQSVIRNGLVKELSPAALLLLLALWHESERYSTRLFTRSTRKMIELVGGSRNSHAKARAELTKVGFAVITSKGVEGFEFHLCNPDTSKPWPLHPRAKAVAPRRSASQVFIASEADGLQQAPRAPRRPHVKEIGLVDEHRESQPADEIQDVNKPEDTAVITEEESPGTSFHFGFNALEKSGPRLQHQSKSSPLSWADVIGGNDKF